MADDEGMKGRGRGTRKAFENIYEVVPREEAWWVIRQRGGYREPFPDREVALRRACQICRQLAPARVWVLDGAGELVEEVVFTRAPALKA